MFLKRPGIYTVGLLLFRSVFRHIGVDVSLTNIRVKSLEYVSYMQFKIKPGIETGPLGISNVVNQFLS